jgi:hypothetical protein
LNLRVEWAFHDPTFRRKADGPGSQKKLSEKEIGGIVGAAFAAFTSRPLILPAPEWRKDFGAGEANCVKADRRSPLSRARALAQFAPALPCHYQESRQNGTSGEVSRDLEGEKRGGNRAGLPISNLLGVWGCPKPHLPKSAKSFEVLVSAAGIEPATHALKGHCSTN